ncbi:glycosyltransferase [Pectobacterium versatile]|uniref:glycosyltransferase n=1 Tax=Pectobacterium versatile TaxID=2488639 RepID=UPI001B37938E|nr:glycosyltransferase [Pectobacterium versatile]MBQ4776528.1 glycosyltransferase [Pectobacterium versatile]
MNKSKPAVAILLAAYNGVKWIEQQILSILSQDNVCCDIYISVDLSSDNTYNFLSEVFKDNIRINLLSYGERFGGAGRNFYRLIKDVDFNKYDYIALSDQDDIWLPNKLGKAILCMQKNDCAAYSSNVLAFWDNGCQKLIRKSYTQKKYDHFFEAAGPGCTYVFKEQPFSKFKKFLTENWDYAINIKLHDWLIYAYFKENHYKWIISDDYDMLYRQHSNNQVGVNVGVHAYRKRVTQIINKSYKGEVNKIVNLLNSEKFNFNKKFLIINFFQLRRRFRDAVVLLFFILLGFL